MPHRIEVAFKPEIRDALGEANKKQITEDLKIPVGSVRTADVYTIDKEFSEEHLRLLGQELFADSIIQTFSYDGSLAKDFDWLVEVGYLPGVKDTWGETSKDAIKDILKEGFRDDEAVYTSKQYLISGNLRREDVDRIARDLLANEIVQRWVITDYRSFMEKGHFMPIPKVAIPHKPSISYIDMDVSDEELLGISERRKLALNLEEIHEIRAYFSRPDVIEKRKKLGLGEKPTDAELEMLAQTWSEHCKHKIFNAKIKYEHDRESDNAVKRFFGRIRDIFGGKTIDSIFDTYIKSSTKELQKELPWIVSTLWDNSGVVRFNDKWLLAFKCETHNSPSNEDPYGGAITGIVGVYRDPMGTGKGCRLIYGTYGFFTGDPSYDGDLRPKLHPKRLREGVRKGVEHGGNKSGVPTPFGVTYSHDGYMGKPAIFVLAAGMIPSEVNGEPGHEKKADPDDLIVMCGGRVGIDGIHGATESSMEAGEWITRGHVQMGDPFTQKKMHDFLIEARDLGLYQCITDNGAGGLSSSVGEMGFMFSGKGGTSGVELYLDKVPLKYAGLDPWQILVSESQERMTLAVNPDKIDELIKLARKHDVEATVLGRFTDSGKFYATYNDKTVTYMDMDFVHNGVPQMRLEAEWLTPKERGLYEPVLEDVVDHASLLKEILARPNICSKEYIIRQFDHEVQGTSAIKHLVGKDGDVHGDGAVIKPTFDSKEGIAISAGINPAYSQIDTYHMTACAIDEAIRRVIALGGSLKQISLNDNFCWPSPLPAENNPDAKYKLAQLIRANEALKDYTMAFKTPCVSGKDSMSMDGTVADANGNKRRISALPTLQFSSAGKIDNVEKCITMDVKKPGDMVYVLGMTYDEMGGSEYYEMKDEVGLNVPRVDAKKSIKLYNALSQATEEGLVASASGCYKGGLGVTLAQISFAGGYGLDVDMKKVPAKSLDREEKILYSGSAGRFVVTVSPENKERFEKIMGRNVCRQIGYVTNNDGFRVTGLAGKPIIEEDICNLKEAYKSTYGR